MPTPSASPVSSAPSPTPSVLTYGLTDRVVVLGQTGTGKTFLVRQLLRDRPYVVVIDTKDDPEGPHTWSGYEVFETLQEMADASAKDPLEHSRLVYRPSLLALRELQRGSGDRLSEIDAVFRWVYKRGGTTLYIDEAYDVTSGPVVFPYGYHQCLSRGRSQQVSTVTSSQRPSGVPRIIFTEAEHYFVFFLKSRDDRVRVQEYTGISEDSIAVLPKRVFYRASQAETPLGPLRLRMEG